MTNDQINALRARGHLVDLHGKEYITHAGLLEMAHEQGIKSIITELISWDPERRAAVVMATATGERGTFTGLGDASPENVGRNIANATLRMAETRASNRAMRSYLGVGMTTAEEMPGDSPSSPSRASQAACPECGSPVWDNVEKRAGGWRGPAFKCKGKDRSDPGCGWVAWEAADAPWKLQPTDTDPPADDAPPPWDDDIPF
jgi:hypothetical protein